MALMNAILAIRISQLKADDYIAFWELLEREICNIEIHLIS